MKNSQPASQTDLNKLEKQIDKKFDQFGEQIIEAITSTNEKIDSINEKIDRLRDDIYSELRTIKNDIAEIKDRLTGLDKRTIEDSNAFSQEIVKLQKEIKTIARKVKKLETQKI